MIIKATDKAIKEMNKNEISEKDVLIDRVIIVNKLNPLERLINVIVIMDNKYSIRIKHPKDEKNLTYSEVEYIDNIWKKK